MNTPETFGIKSGRGKVKNATTAKLAPEKKTLKRPTKTAQAAKAVTAATPKRAVKPAVPMHQIAMNGYAGVSGVANERLSRTAINYDKFGTLKDAAMTDRDQKALQALRDEFGKNVFTRANLDAGIIRRLGERGRLEHVGGSPVDPLAKFRLTKLGLGQASA